MDNIWETVKIGEIANVKGGKRLPKGLKVQDEKTDFPYIRVVDFEEYGININSVKYITQEAHKKISRYTISTSDVYISIAGTIGLVGMIPQELNNANLTENAAKICDISEEINPKFLMYFLKSEFGQALIQAQVVGTSQPKLALFRIKEIEIPKPPISIQNKIVSILSTYDDLIENNNRRIAILEEMARRLYREWFVHFRFPGHEKVKMVDSELGKIPEGWEVKKLEDVCFLTMGQSPKSEYYNEKKDGIPFFQGVADFGLRFPKERVYCTKPTRFAEKGDILFSVRAPVGRLNIANQKLAIGRGLSAIRHKKNYQAFLFQQMKHIFKEEDIMGNGAIFNSVTKKDMQNIKILVPKDEISEGFERTISPIFELIDSLDMKNENLKKQRDLLLPKLISGEIYV